MVRNNDGTYDIVIGYKQKVFTGLNEDEGFSALLTVADHYNGIARYNGEIIKDFTTV